jgi:single-stranded-DNA-specific exonuclease
VMTYNNDVIVGSGRSMGEKNIGLLMMNAVEKGILIKGGGHHKACGFTLRQENLNQFREYLLSETDSLIIENNKQYESVLDINVINDKLLDDLDVLSPYGQLNPEPVFKLEKVKIKILQIFKDKHAKLKFSDDLDFSCEGMFFDINAQDLKGYLSSKDEFDCYFKVKKDTYSSKTIIHLEDIH